MKIKKHYIKYKYNLKFKKHLLKFGFVGFKIILFRRITKKKEEYLKLIILKKLKELTKRKLKV